MVHLHFRILSGSVAVLFFVGSILSSSVCSAAGKSSPGLNAEEKRIIMGAQKLKKRKKAESEKKAASKKEQQTPSRQKKRVRGTDER